MSMREGGIDPGNACMNPQTKCGGEGGGKEGGVREGRRRLVIDMMA